jgi:hypothetical protein
MATGDILTLTSDEILIMSDTIDDMIVNFGKDCLLVYPAKQIPCNNCILAPIQGGNGFRSTNTYKQGGPIPFITGNLCPVCGGRGMISQAEKTSVVKLLCRWNPADFILLPGSIEVPFSVVETEGLLTDWPRVQQSRVMIVELPIQPYIRARFELSGEPVDVNSIAQAKTFTCHWTRRG